jgi:hypothetical protein
MQVPLTGRGVKSPENGVGPEVGKALGRAAEGAGDEFGAGVNQGSSW